MRIVEQPPSPESRVSGKAGSLLAHSLARWLQQCGPAPPPGTRRGVAHHAERDGAPRESLGHWPEFPFHSLVREMTRRRKAVASVAPAVPVDPPPSPSLADQMRAVANWAWNPQPPLPEAAALCVVCNSAS